MKTILLSIRILMALFQRLFNFLTLGHLPPFISVVTVIRNGDKFLLIKRSDGKGMGFPGGYLRLYETVEDAARREVKEETGMDVEIIRILGTLSGNRPGVWVGTADIVFEGRVIGGKLQNSIEGRSGWFTLDEIRDNLAFDYAKIIPRLNQNPNRATIEDADPKIPD